MEQFSLEKYLEDPNKKIITRNGDPVRIICTDANSDHCIIALVYTEEEEEETPYSYYEDGKYLSCSDCGCDLFFASKEEEYPFKRGDRVLVRNMDDERWCNHIFGGYDKDYSRKYWCEDDCIRYMQCIPYNEHTWHLLDTTDEYKEE